MRHVAKASALVLTLVCLGAIAVGIAFWSAASPALAAPPPPEAPGPPEYMVIAWNDLGMHCYNPSFQELAVLPPWNTLYAQVVRIGDPPMIMTAGLSVTYYFSDNTYSVGKTDFWDISPYSGVQNAQWLFDLADPLPPDVGLTGVGLSGTMEVEGDHFKAEGIPLTEYSDSAPNTRMPYQLATVVVRRAGTGEILAQVHPVAPVSTEMHCEYCHYDNGPGNEDVATGNVFQNILTTHDNENQDEYPPGYDALMNMRPVLCAWCHASPILGAPGEPDIPNFSNALHGQHSGIIPNTQAGCYNCHPGPETQCQRGVMYAEFGLVCVDCHGTMEDVANKTTPWFEEPRCDNAGCHPAFTQDDPLYRLSKDHGGMFCEACHDSTHAIAPSAEPLDGLKFVTLQGYDGSLRKCTVCHATLPTDPGPHGLLPGALPAWDKEIWIGGTMFTPSDSPFKVEPGDDVLIVDNVQVTGAEVITFSLTEEWSGPIDLVEYDVTGGVVTPGMGTIDWSVTDGLSNTWYTLSKTFSVSAISGVAYLTETLTVWDGPRVGTIRFEIDSAWPYSIYLPVMYRMNP